MEISKYMKRHVVSIPETSTIRETAAVLVKHHIGLLPVVDKHKKLVGMMVLVAMLELPGFHSTIF